MSVAHEILIDSGKEKRSSERGFGLTFGIVFLALAIYLYVFSTQAISIPLLLSFVSALFFIAALLFPAALKYPNNYWMKFAHLLAKVTNPIVMFLLFLFVIAPAALFMKALRFDPMARKFDPKADSYWKKRPTMNSSVQSMKNQF